MAEEFLKNYPPMRPLPSSKLGPDEQTRLILFVGDAKVGKTTFIRRYCEYMRMHYRCDTTRGQFLIFTQFIHFRVDGGKRFPIRFLDVPPGLTSGYRNNQYPNFVHSVVLCYAIDDLVSFTNVWDVWFREFRSHLSPYTRFHLLALKCDMRLELEAAGRPFVDRETAEQRLRGNAFSGLFFEVSVEGNPEQARNCMEALIDEAFANEAYGPLRVPPP